MKKRTVVKLVSFFSVAVFVALGMFIKENQKARRYKLMVQNEYSQSLNQLNSSLDNISYLLEKTTYMSSPKQISSFAAGIFSEAELAKSALSNLPSGENGLNTVYKFLSQVGNYSLSVSKSAISKNEITNRQREELKLLSQTATQFSSVISDSQISFNNPQYWADEIDEKLSHTVNEESLATSLTQLEENLTDYPTLIYDGPYSDHILNKQPLMISNAREFSQQEALIAAASILNNSENLQFADMQNGKIEGYRFVDGDTTVCITKKGGYPLYMRKNRTVGDTQYTYEQALSKAKGFLKKTQFDNMIETYYFTDSGVCVINFAYLDGQTICYTDLIKVGVAMDTGEIVLFESGGYLTNHTSRAFEMPAYTETDAAQIVNGELEIQSTSIALIPTDSGGEVRCFEFLCKSAKGEDVLVYVNLLDLQEEQFFILLKTDGGTLVK